MQHSLFQASTDEDGRLRTVYLSIHPCGQWTKIWAQTDHLMDKFGRWTKIIILRWTSGRIFDSMDGFGRRTINISTRWMMVDEWTGRRMKQTDGRTDDPLTFFCEESPLDYIQLTIEV